MSEHSKIVRKIQERYQRAKVWWKPAGRRYAILSVRYAIDSFQLKTKFKEVAALQEKSGFGWDDNFKLVTVTREVWDALIEIQPFIHMQPISKTFTEQAWTQKIEEKALPATWQHF